MPKPLRLEAAGQPGLIADRRAKTGLWRSSSCEAASTAGAVFAVTRRSVARRSRAAAAPQGRRGWELEQAADGPEPGGSPSTPHHPGRSVPAAAGAGAQRCLWVVSILESSSSVTYSKSVTTRVTPETCEEMMAARWPSF